MRRRSLHTKESGFTLIELLVVISIIALLSAIVLTALSDARAKARNASRVTLVRQYMNALELYRSNNGDRYPYDPAVGTVTRVCLGVKSPSSTCINSNPYFGNLTIFNALGTYIPGPPAMTDKISVSGTDMSGLTYACLSASNNTCTKYELYWFGEGSKPFCGPGAIGVSSNSITECIVTSN